MYQRVRNIRFSENFAYVLNEWPCTKKPDIHNQSSYSNVQIEIGNDSKKNVW